MLTLGIAGLANVTGFLERHFPRADGAGFACCAGHGCRGCAVAGRQGARRGFGGTLRPQQEKRRVSVSGHSVLPRCRPARRWLKCGDVCCNFNFGRYRPIYAADDLARAYWQECLAPDAIFGMLKAAVPSRQRHALPPDGPSRRAFARRAGEQRVRASALAVVMDAAGEIAATSVYSLRRVRRSPASSRYPVTQSLGMFYSLVTQFLGYAFNEDEYKVMGLASFGDPGRYRAYFRSAIRLGAEWQRRNSLPDAESQLCRRPVLYRQRRRTGRGIGNRRHELRASGSAPMSAPRCRSASREALFHICGHYQTADQGDEPAAERRLCGELCRDRRTAVQRHVRAYPRRLCLRR